MEVKTKNIRMSPVKALKTYLEAEPSGRKVTIEELKALTPDERVHMGSLAAEALGVELETR
jgi:hypothetical protein